MSYPRVNELGQRICSLIDQAAECGFFVYASECLGLLWGLADPQYVIYWERMQRLLRENQPALLEKRSAVSVLGGEGK
ncbi:MAG: hypothetical protein AB1656_13550 [Candidatus Omnitrophota bacterium]